MAVSLPDLQTDGGTLAMLLLAESRTPAFGDYDLAAAKKGMQAMKAVVNNRLTNNPAQFNAAGATNWRDIITATNQFAGFSADDANQVVVASAIVSRVNDIINRANAEDGPAFGPWTDHVNAALSVVSDTVSDPFATLPATIDDTVVLQGGFGWRPVTAGSPGGRFIAIPSSLGGVILGNQFYTITPA